MATPFIGEIKLVPYTFAPLGWVFCHGQLLPISQYDALFALIGTTYGGDGQETFGLPDLRGRVIEGYDDSFAPLGTQAGVESVSLLPGQVPAHSHTLGVGTAPGTTSDPSGRYLAESSIAGLKPYGSAGSSSMSSNTIASAGGGQPHDNMQPYLVMNYIIATEGIFPPRS